MTRHTFPRPTAASGSRHPDEDTHHDFSPGGWSVPYSDEVIGRAMGGRIATSDGLLLGRRTYEAMPTSTGVVIATYRPVSA